MSPNHSVILSAAKDLSFKSLAIILVLVLIPIVLLLRLRQTPTPVAADWWNSSWQYRQAIGISNPSGSALTDFEVNLSIGTSSLVAAGKMKTNCADIRVTDINGKLLPHWVETGAKGCNSSGNNTYVWVKIPSIPISGTTVYIYYSNPSAANIENGDNVFKFFDDFNNGPLSGSKWTSGTIAATTGPSFTNVGTSLGGGNNNRYIKSTTAFTGNYTVETRFYETTSATNGFMSSGFYNSSTQALGILTHNGTTYWRNNTTWTNIGAYTAGQWTRDTVKMISIYGTVSHVNENTGSGIVIQNTNSIGVTSASVRLGARYDDSNVDQNFSTQWDWIFVRQAVANEPAASLTGSEEQSPGPIAYWKFDEGAGTQVNNAGIGGTLTGTFAAGSSAPVWTADSDCISGKCLSFSGANYLSFGNQSVLKVPSKTISFWAKPTASFSNVIPVFSAVSGNYYVGFNTNGRMVSSHLNSSAAQKTFSSANNTVDIDSWQYFTYVFSVSGSDVTLTFYKNGRQIATTTFNDGYYSAYGSNFIVGAFATNSLFYIGAIDDLKVYSYVRTPAQILADYNSFSAATAKGNAAILGNIQTGGTPPVAYWNFNEGTGTTAYDSSTNNIHAAFAAGTSAPTWSSGKLGKSLSFDGNDYLSVSDNSLLGSGTMTISAWVYPTTFVSGAAIYNRRTTGTNIGGVTMELVGTSGSFNCYFYISGAWRSIASNQLLKLNQWNYATCSYDGSTIVPYVNAVRDTGTTAIAGSINNPASPTVIIGCNIASMATCWKGQIDDLKVYDYTRSQSQISQDMNANHPVGNTISATAYYKFDEGFGSIANNSGSATSLLNGILGTGSSAPTWTNSGKFGKALKFNGTNNYVDISSVSGLPTVGTAPMTIEAWVNISSFSSASKIIARWNDSGNGWSWLLQSNTNGTLSFYRQWNNNGSVATSDPLTINTWYHVVAIFDGSVSNIYINGKISGTNTLSNFYGSGDSSVVSLGAGQNGGARNNFYNGLLDEVKIYNYALSPTDILIDYNRGQALNFGANSQNTGNTAPITAFSQTYCVPGDTSSCAPPVGEWNLDEGTGTTGYDSSGNNNNVGFSGAAWTPGKMGKAVSFTGTNGYVGATDPGTSVLDIAGNFTAEAWVNWSSFKDYGVVLNKGSGGSVSAFNYAIWSYANQVVGYIGNGTNGGAVYLTNLPTLNTWHHIAFSADGSYLRLYVDGVQSTLAAQTFTPGPNNSRFEISDPSYTINGKIDQVRVYNYARTPAQIALDYNRGGPVAWYKFDECQGNIVHDAANIGASGSVVIGANGTQNSLGTCAVGTSAAWTGGTQGKYNSSLNFDGTDDYVTVSNFYSDVGVGTSGSVSAWIKTPSTQSNKGIVSLNSRPLLYIGSNDNVGAYNANGIIYACWVPIPNHNVFNHFVWVWGGSNMTIYLNGQIGCTTSSWDSTYARSVGNINIGSYSTSTNILTGQIDDVRIYNYPLTTTQIQTLYNNNSAINFNQITPTP